MTETCSAVLRSRRNCISDGTERTDDGRAFHARAAVTGKARSPSVVRRVDGMTSVVMMMSSVQVLRTSLDVRSPRHPELNLTVLFFFRLVPSTYSPFRQHRLRAGRRKLRRRATHDIRSLFSG